MDLRPTQSRRKAISPVLATVILIAITLIAAIAVAGFVFGLFGSFTSTAQVGGVQEYILAADSSKATGLTSATCAAAAGADYIAFKNTGTGSTSINTFSLIYGGQTLSASAAGGAACKLVAGGATVYVNLVFSGAAGPTTSSGQQFTGSVGLSNGATAQYTGTFQ